MRCYCCIYCTRPTSGIIRTTRIIITSRLLETGQWYCIILYYIIEQQLATPLHDYYNIIAVSRVINFVRTSVVWFERVLAMPKY